MSPWGQRSQISDNWCHLCVCGQDVFGRGSAHGAWEWCRDLYAFVVCRPSLAYVFYAGQLSFQLTFLSKRALLIVVPLSMRCLGHRGDSSTGYIYPSWSPHAHGHQKHFDTKESCISVASYTITASSSSHSVTTVSPAHMHKGQPNSNVMMSQTCLMLGIHPSDSIATKMSMSTLQLDLTQFTTLSFCCSWHSALSSYSVFHHQIYGMMFSSFGGDCTIDGLLTDDDYCPPTKEESPRN
jgi:hypothetical protein